MGAPEVLEAAHRAKANGSTRFCMGAAWRGVRAGTEKFEQVLGIVREVSQLGMEVCVTLGQLTGTEAAQLKEAGVTAYNHNIDTSPDYYPEIVSTHTFQDRLNTIQAVQESGMALCCGGIVGLGETVGGPAQDARRADRARPRAGKRTHQLPDGHARHAAGGPAAGGHLRTGAPDRHHPDRPARLAGAALGGAHAPEPEGQALCFFAGANSVFYGDKLLTASNPAARADLALLRALDLRPHTLPVAAAPYRGK